MPRRTARVLGSPIDIVSQDDAIALIERWAAFGESRYVCNANVHSIVTAAREPGFARILAEADMATPDGAPVAWMLRRLGHAAQRRVSGPDLMWRYCERAAMHGEGIFLYGGSEATMSALRQRLRLAFPALRIVGAISPPFRPLSRAEDETDVACINASGTGTVWVGLGCPKQELWMARHRGRVQAVMIGVGAAFDYHAGVHRRAPYWMRQSGLEWLHRLCHDPRRLWRRYLLTNSAFVGGALRQLAWPPAPDSETPLRAVEQHALDEALIPIEKNDIQIDSDRLLK